MFSNLSESGHGLANKKITDIASDWIKKNSVQIKGYSSDRNSLSQLCLLTNEQIKECYKKVDPLFKIKNSL